MTLGKKVLLVGASGLVGSAVLRQFHAAGNDLVAVSRKPPLDICAATFVPAALVDEGAPWGRFGQLTDVTHLVYAALHERPTLVAGWSDAQQIEINARMFRNVLDPLPSC